MKKTQKKKNVAVKKFVKIVVSEAKAKKGARTNGQNMNC